MHVVSLLQNHGSVGIARKISYMYMYKNEIVTDALNLSYVHTCR